MILYQQHNKIKKKKATTITMFDDDDGGEATRWLNLKKGVSDVGISVNLSSLRGQHSDIKSTPENGGQGLLLS